LSSIGLIGAGNMGTALVRGLIASGRATGEELVVFDIDEKVTGRLEEEFDVTAASSAGDTVRTETETLVLAVKPQIMGSVLEEISDRVGDRPLVVTIAAGVPCAFYLSRLPEGVRLIRAMPNAAAMVGHAATALCKAGAANDEDLRSAVGLFSAFGTAVVVQEKMMNAATALSGSGPGYLFPILEGLVDGGVLMGLDRATARELAVQTMLGAAAMAAEEDASFSELKDRITSPGGTTIAGLRVMERAGLRGILMDTIKAATERADELQS
jgi:pyrroline-5-carboxylate reductase